MRKSFRRTLCFINWLLHLGFCDLKLFKKCLLLDGKGWGNKERIISWQGSSALLEPPECAKLQGNLGLQSHCKNVVGVLPVDSQSETIKPWFSLLTLSAQDFTASQSLEGMLMAIWSKPWLTQAPPPRLSWWGGWGGCSQLDPLFASAPNWELYSMCWRSKVSCS